jgi:hypothetical protein
MPLKTKEERIVSTCYLSPLSLSFHFAGQEPSKVRRVLMSESTTVVQKRAIMRLAYGDYHEQMRRDPEPRHPEGTSFLAIHVTGPLALLFQATVSARTSFL